MYSETEHCISSDLVFCLLLCFLLYAGNSLCCLQQYSPFVGALNNGDIWHEAGSVEHEDGQSNPITFDFPPRVCIVNMTMHFVHSCSHSIK